MLAALAVLNVALYWICIPYRTQQRFTLQVLGLAAVPLARLLDRWRGLRLTAAALLCLHLMTTQTWPLTLEERKIPWDLNPKIPNAVSGPLPLFARVERARPSGPDPAALAGLFLLLGTGCCALLIVWSGQPTQPMPRPRTCEFCSSCRRSSGTWRPGRIANGRLAARCQATILPACCSPCSMQAG